MNLDHTDARGFEQWDKLDLHNLADELLLCEAPAIEKCVQFILAETCGVWHGRARAMMCRRLKHCPVPAELAQQLVACITERLASGRFSEQFRDQLRLAIQLDPERTIAVARKCLSGGSKDYIKKFARWVLDHRRDGRARGAR